MTNELDSGAVGHIAYALGRAIEQLDKVEDFAADSATTLIQNVDNLRYLRRGVMADEGLIEHQDSTCQGESCAPTAVPVESKEPESEKVVPFTATEEETPFDTEPAEPAKSYGKTEVRAALGIARTKGMDVPEFLQEFAGVDSFSKCPEGKYGEIMDELKKRGYA